MFFLLKNEKVSFPPLCYFSFFHSSFLKSIFGCNWESQSILLSYSFLPLKLFFLSFFKMGQSRPLSVYFRSFLLTISIQIEKSIDGVLGIRTRGRRMVGTDETTELWRPLWVVFSLYFWTSVRYALGREFAPRRCQTLFQTPKSTTSAHFIMIYLIWN